MRARSGNCRLPILNAFDETGERTMIVFDRRSNDRTQKLATSVIKRHHGHHVSDLRKADKPPVPIPAGCRSQDIPVVPFVRLAWSLAGNRPRILFSVRIGRYLNFRTVTAICIYPESTRNHRLLKIELRLLTTVECLRYLHWA